MALDAFGRLRTSDNFTTFNYYPSPMTANTSLDIDIWISEQTGGSQSYESENYIKMPTSGSGDTYSLRTTKQPMIYQPGKSRLIYMTGVLMTTINSSTNSYMGIFNVNTPPTINQGTYLRCNGVNLFWEDVMQTSTTSVTQSAWNIDTFNGNGPSGKTLTVANAAENLLIVIDQEWLGVGRIRCGFIIDGVIYYAHQFFHNGMTIQYTNTPRLHLSYLIQSTSVNSMRQMCSTNIIEGGYFTTGRINNISIPITSPTSFVSVNSTTEIILLGIRIQSRFPNATFFLKALSIYFTAGGSGRYALYKVQLFSTKGSIGNLVQPTSLSWQTLSNSSVEYAFGGTTGSYVSSSGFIISSGYLDTTSSNNISLSEFDSLQTHQLFTSYDTMYITGIASNSGTMGATVTFIEDI